MMRKKQALPTTGFVTFGVFKVALGQTQSRDFNEV